MHLIVDQDGKTLLAVSSARARKHVLATITPSAENYDLAMSHRRGRDLRFSPRADLVGYRFDFGEPKGPPLRDADDEGEILDDEPELREVPGVRLKTLPMFPATRERLEKLLR